MTDHPKQSQPGDDPDLGELVTACLAAVEESGLGAVDDFCTRHPRLAKALRRRIDALADAGLLDFGSAARAPTTPSQFGDYTVCGELGVGGMGVVYRATQSGIDREVAIKTIRPELLASAAARKRFEREIATVAKLSHPGIVPVFASGEQDGLPWFAMERITGSSLAALLGACGERAFANANGAALREALATAAGGEIEEAPVFGMSWREAGLTVGRDIAAALDHAHRAGVLHRDVKPSNILLGADGRARLVDFGLARDDATDASATLTRTGALVGSLPYMAPEQVRGEVSDRRTDVYGLAATLVEWLTGSPPFSAPTEADLRTAILGGEPPALARRNARLPADLVAVLEQALDPDRDRRYATAAEFARDLDAVLELAPVTARPASSWLRLRRLARRRPAATLAVLVAAILAIAVPVALLIVNAQIREARDRAEARFHDARDAIVGLAARVGDEDLRNVPGAAPIRLDVMERSIALFERLLTERPDDYDLQLQHARLQRQTAHVLGQMGRADDAKRARSQAEATMRRVLAEEPQLHRAAANDLADLLVDRSVVRGASVFELLDEAEALLGPDPGPGTIPSDRQFWFALRRQLLHNRAVSQNDTGSETAIEVGDAALAVAGHWLAEFPTNAQARLGHAASMGLRGLLRHEAGRHEEARRDFDAATDELSRLVADDPATAHRARLGLHLGNHANLLYQAGNYEPAETRAREAVDCLTQLTSEQPYRRDLQRRLAMAHEAVGLALAGQDRAAEAAESFVRSANALTQLLALDRADRRVALRLGLARYNCAAAFLDLGRRAAAAGHSATALTILTELAQQPGQRAAKRYAVFARLLDTRAGLSRGDEPTPAALTAIVAEQANGDREAWFLLAQTHADLATAMNDAAHASAALEALENAIDRGFSAGRRIDEAALFEELRDDPKFRQLRGRVGG
ncbi:MAG: serine/threonine protein kinase [bacterium]|nr:serine/threonine protein kinase [bacterium]